jgi:hypothetical protein
MEINTSQAVAFHIVCFVFRKDLLPSILLPNMETSKLPVYFYKRELTLMSKERMV